LILGYSKKIANADSVKILFQFELRKIWMLRINL
jgi:hypothetical protein